MSESPASADVLAKVGRAFAHPVRAALIDAMRDGSVLSPARFSETSGVPVNDVGYHARALQKLGVLRLVDVRPVRGAKEHFYALTGANAPLVLVALDAVRTEAELGRQDGHDGQPERGENQARDKG